jgi:hypothetical protein
MMAADKGLDALVCLGASPAANVSDYVAAAGCKEVKILMPTSVPSMDFLASVAYTFTTYVERVLETFENINV